MSPGMPRLIHSKYATIAFIAWLSSGMPRPLRLRSMQPFTLMRSWIGCFTFSTAE